MSLLLWYVIDVKTQTHMFISKRTMRRDPAEKVVAMVMREIQKGTRMARIENCLSSKF